MIIVSMDSWLSADPQNVAVVHCIGNLSFIINRGVLNFRSFQEEKAGQGR